MGNPASGRHIQAKKINKSPIADSIPLTGITCQETAPQIGKGREERYYKFPAVKGKGSLSGFTLPGGF